MSNATKSAMNQPLRGIRVLVGRARHQARALSRELRGLGAQVIEIPFIEIRKPRSFKPLDHALRNLDAYDWLILTSVNGVEMMWERLKALGLANRNREGHGLSRAVTGHFDLEALAPEGRRGKRLRVAAIGPATKKAIEQRGVKVDVVPREYVAESVVRVLRRKVKGKRVLLVRAKVARDVIPRELGKAGAHVDVVEAYETVAPRASRTRLRALLRDDRKRPHIITFTSSSTVRNFCALASRASLRGIRTASIGPVTSATLRELGLGVDIEAKSYTISGLVEAIVKWQLPGTS
jgi:uroporphyrinogen-III synthase